MAELAPMLEVWSHAGDVTYMGPGGDFRVGWDQVLASWKEQAAMKLGGKVHSDNMHVVVGHDLAVTHNVEIGENAKESGRRSERPAPRRQRSDQRRTRSSRAWLRNDSRDLISLGSIPDQFEETKPRPSIPTVVGGSR